MRYKEGSIMHSFTEYQSWTKVGNFSVIFCFDQLFIFITLFKEFAIFVLDFAEADICSVVLVECIFIYETIH